MPPKQRGTWALRYSPEGGVDQIQIRTPELDDLDEPKVDWAPTQGEDKRDSRDPEKVGKAWLRRKRKK